MNEIPTLKRKHTLMAIGYGALLLVWLTPEDNTIIIVSVLGVGLSLMIVLLSVMRWFGGRPLAPRGWIIGMVLLGALTGFGAVWTTITLMVFKNAWHAHAALDFPGEVVVGIVKRVIPWTISGALLGGALALFRSSD